MQKFFAIEFDKSAITATDIRSNVAPTSVIYFNSELINLFTSL
jgi:hypothetical protein